MSQEKHLFVGGAGAVGASFIYALSGGYTNNKSSLPKRHFTLLCRENKKEYLKNLKHLSIYNLDKPFKFQILTNIVFIICLYFILSHIFSNYIFFTENSSFFLRFFVFVFSIAISFYLTVFKLKPLVRFFTLKATKEKIEYHDVISSPIDVDPETRYIWIAISSDQLLKLPENFFTDLLSKAKNADIISLTPSIGDTDFIISKLPKELKGRVGQVTVPFLSYQVPLKNESFSFVKLDKSYDPNAPINTHIAIFYLPTTYIALGNADRRDELSKILKDCEITHFHWEFSPNALEAMLTDTVSIFYLLIFGMKNSGWKLKKLDLPTLERAAVEISNVLSYNILERYNFCFTREVDEEERKKYKSYENPNFYPENGGDKIKELNDKFYGSVSSKIVSPKTVNQYYTYLPMLVPHFFPFDFEAYCVYHFGNKVWTQSLKVSEDWLAMAEKYNFPHENYERLQKELYK